jgi:hypothetical protein
MSGEGFTNDPVLRQLQLALTGYGYNFYDKKNQARADDLLVRQKAAGSLEDAVQALTRLEAEFRRRYIPPATRENPFPPAEAMDKWKDIGQLKERISLIASRIRGMPVPTQDRTWARFRSELPMLKQLLNFDLWLVNLTEGVFQHVQTLTPAGWQEGNGLGEFDQQLGGLDNLIRDRQRFLLQMGG